MFGSLLPPRKDGGPRTIQATTWGSWGGDSAATWAGVPVDTKSALQLLTVYGCTRFICDGIATLPVDTLRRTPDGPQPAPVPGWLEEPTVGLDRVAWTTQVLSSLLLAGNAYLFLEYDGPGGPKSLTPLDPAKVEPRREKGRRVFLVDGRTVDGFNILHIPGVMLPGAEKGLSPVEAARQSIGQGLSAQEFGARFFGQGAVMSGVIEAPQDMPPEKTREMAKAWARHHSGKSKSHLPGVLTGGATWKQTSITNEQAQFLQTRGFTAAEIAGQMFLVDPTELGIPTQENSSAITYANLEQRNARLVRVTFLPWIVRLERALSSLMLKPRYVKFNVGGLLRGDQKSRFESYAIGVKNQFMVPNEAREFEDWAPLDGGDTVVKKPTSTGVPNA